MFIIPELSQFVVKTGNIENAFILLNTPENAERRAKLIEKTSMIDLAEEYARIEERNAARDRCSGSLGSIERETGAVIYQYVKQFVRGFRLPILKKG